MRAAMNFLATFLVIAVSTPAATPWAAEPSKRVARFQLAPGEQLVSIFENTHRGIQIVTYDPRTRECTMRYYKVAEARRGERSLMERTNSVTLVLTECLPAGSVR